MGRAIAAREGFSIDHRLVAIYLSLVGLGLVLFYSSGISAHGSFMAFMPKKLLHVLAGLAAFTIAARIPYTLYQRYRGVVLLVSVVLLILPLIPGLGILRYGARRWIDLGLVSFQPSELVKPLFAIYLAGFVAQRREEIRGLMTGIVPSLIVGVTLFGLLMLEPDLGSAIILVTLVGAYLFLGGARIVHLALIVVVGVILGGAMILGSAERRDRVKCYIWPDRCPAGEAYHLDHAQWAFGSGGPVGVGLGQGLETSQGFLLKPQSDFIGAVIGEELGFVGTMGVLLAFVLLFLVAASISARAPDDLGRFMALGLGFLIALHALIHMGVTMRLLPTKGLCLPLLSAGGSAMIGQSYAVGVITNIAWAGRQAARQAEEDGVGSSYWSRLKGDRK